MTLILPNAFSGKPNLIEDSRQFTLGMENELTHNKKINTPGSSTVINSSYIDWGDRVDNLWANGIADKVLIQVGFQAFYQSLSGTSTFGAAIFINGNQLKNVVQGGATTVNEGLGTATAGAGKQWFGTTHDGMIVPNTQAVSPTSGITTGMIVALPVQAKGGLCNIIVPSAILTPFTVNIRFKCSTGTVTVSERKLWVRVCAMTN